MFLTTALYAALAALIILALAANPVRPRLRPLASLADAFRGQLPRAVRPPAPSRTSLAINRQSRSV